MSKICKALSLMKVKHDKQKSEAIEEHRELLRLAKIGEAVEHAVNCGLRVTDYMGGQEIHTSLNDVEELTDWHRNEVSND